DSAEGIDMPPTGQPRDAPWRTLHHQARASAPVDPQEYLVQSGRDGELGCFSVSHIAHMLAINIDAICPQEVHPIGCAPGDLDSRSLSGIGTAALHEAPPLPIY